jgi:hypothetical protein
MPPAGGERRVAEHLMLPDGSYSTVFFAYRYYEISYLRARELEREYRRTGAFDSAAYYSQLADQIELSRATNGRVVVHYGKPPAVKSWWDEWTEKLLRPERTPHSMTSASSSGTGDE